MLVVVPALVEAEVGLLRVINTYCTRQRCHRCSLLAARQNSRLANRAHCQCGEVGEGLPPETVRHVPI